jgi:hypothetical protein
MSSNRNFLDNQELRIKFQFHLIHAFIGKIDFKIRGIQSSYESINNTRVICYFDGEITEEDREEIAEVEDEIIAAFCSPYNATNIWFETIRLDSPNPLPQDNLAEWFYRRKEPQQN